MSPWRLEVARLWRTRRLVAVGGAYVILGLSIPVLTYYLPSIVAHSDTGGLKLVVPRQTPADALVGCGQNAGQLGTLAVIVVAAAGLAIDARPALAAFYRTRARSGSRLLLPRYATTRAAAVVCFGLGILAAWYETSVLNGPLNAGTLAGGFGIETAWICVCVSVVALWDSGRPRGVRHRRPQPRQPSGAGVRLRHSRRVVVVADQARVKRRGPLRAASSRRPLARARRHGCRDRGAARDCGVASLDPRWTVTRMALRADAMRCRPTETRRSVPVQKDPNPPT
jgi:hypothetical protein